MTQAMVIEGGGEVSDEAGAHRVLRLWRIDDGEWHWLLAIDEDDAWALYVESYQYGDDVTRDVKQLSRAPR